MHEDRAIENDYADALIPKKCLSGPEHCSSEIEQLLKYKIGTEGFFLFHHYKPEEDERKVKKIRFKAFSLFVSNAKLHKAG